MIDLFMDRPLASLDPLYSVRIRLEHSNAVCPVIKSLSLALGWEIMS